MPNVYYFLFYSNPKNFPMINAHFEHRCSQRRKNVNFYIVLMSERYELFAKNKFLQQNCFSFISPIPRILI